MRPPTIATWLFSELALKVPFCLITPDTSVFNPSAERIILFASMTPARLLIMRVLMAAGVVVILLKF